jgi:hypothetical protein
MIHYLLSGSFKLQSLVMSDYELLKSNQLFDKKLLKSPKSHESLIGIGINFFFMNDFEAAREKILSAIKFQPNESIY